MSAYTRGVCDVNGENYAFAINDLVSINVNGKGTKSYKVTNAATGALAYTGTATDAFIWSSTSESQTLSAWSYGGSSTTTADGVTLVTADPNNITFTLSQDQSSNYHELLYSKATSYSYGTNGSIPLQLYHQLARVRFNLTNTSTTSLSINSIYIGDGTTDVIPTTATFKKPTTENIGTWEDIGSQHGHIIPKTETANVCYSAALIPTTYAAGTKLLTITTDDGTFVYSLPSATELLPGKQYAFNVSVRDLVAVSTLTIGDISTYTYDGTAKQPEPTVTDPTSGRVLTKGTHYSLSYSNNINAGTATVTVTGIGVYSGTQDKSFTINRKTLTSSEFYFESSAITRTYIWEIGSGTNVLTMPDDCTVNYTSSNAAVATVSNASTGVLLPGGTLNTTTIITATCTGNYIGTASYTIQATSKVRTFSYTEGIQ